jgi:hypothetical protein
MKTYYTLIFTKTFIFYKLKISLLYIYIQIVQQPMKQIANNANSNKKYSK